MKNPSPLEEWNRLERENTENAIVCSMFLAGVKTSSAIDDFTTWLLVGSAAIGAFFITNADQLIPVISSNGFLVIGMLLCASSLLGIVSKIYGVLCRIGLGVTEAVQETFQKHLEKYAEVEDEIQETAIKSGVSIDTGIRIERVMSEFLKPMPKLVKWMINRQLIKGYTTPQSGYYILVNRFNLQGFFAFLQAILFLSFMTTGIIYAA
jgi:hypothetical protein